MRVICVVFIVWLLVPFTASAATSTPVATITTTQYNALNSLNDLTVVPSSLTLEKALGGASFVGQYSLVHGVSDIHTGFTTNAASLPVYPYTSGVVQCNSQSGDAPNVGAAFDTSVVTTNTYTWQQYLNSCSLGGPACAAAFQQKTIISLGYWVGAGANISVPYVSFVGAPLGAPAPPSERRSSSPIWGVRLAIDNGQVRPRATEGAIPTFAPTSIPSIWSELGSLITPPEIGKVYGSALEYFTAAQIAIGYLKKIRVDIIVPALLQNVLVPTIKVCDYVALDISNPTVVARASATVIPTAITAATAVPANLSYYSLGASWQKVHQGLVSGYRLHCNAVNLSYCVIKILPPLSGYISWKFATGQLPPTYFTGFGGMSSACGNLDGVCYYSWQFPLGAASYDDVYIYCTFYDYSQQTGRICPADINLSSAITVVSSIACPCVNLNATRTAAVPVSPTITSAAIVPTIKPVLTSTTIPTYIAPTALPATAAVNTTLTRTSQAAIFLTQTALAYNRAATLTAAISQQNQTAIAGTATRNAYVNAIASATAVMLNQYGTATARIAQTAVAAATSTQSLLLAQTAQAATTAQALLTSTRVVAIDNGGVTDGRDPAIVYGVTDKLIQTMSIFDALNSLKDLGTAFTDGMANSPCNGLPQSIDGVSLSGGWSFSGMAPALCAVRQWLEAQSTGIPYLRILISALIVLFIFRSVNDYFNHHSNNKQRK